MFLEHFALIVTDYDEAIRFFVDVLEFELVEDSPAKTGEGGRPKRWVVVRPPGAVTGLLLAQADGEGQAGAVGVRRARAKSRLRRTSSRVHSRIRPMFVRAFSLTSGNPGIGGPIRELTVP
jgi:catechol 2,3-dioxygenase-like lactoylglutathione lyase family enzyme